jgi:hypothetical protein
MFAKAKQRVCDVYLILHSFAPYMFLSLIKDGNTGNEQFWIKNGRT